MATQPLVGNPSNTIALASSTSITVPVGGFTGWGFDLNMDAGSVAEGTLEIFSQYTDPNGDPTTYPHTAAYNVTGGKFGGTDTKIVVDNNQVTTGAYIIIKWTGTDTNSKNITLVGYKEIF